MALYCVVIFLQFFEFLNFWMFGRQVEPRTSLSQPSLRIMKNVKDASRGAAGAVQSERKKQQQHRHGHPSGHAKRCTVAVAAGANWKNSVLKHDRVERGKRRGKIAQESKKVSSKPRNGKHVQHLRAISPRKNSGNRAQSFKASGAFPRGKKTLGDAAGDEGDVRVGNRADFQDASSCSSSMGLDEEIEAFVRFVSLSPKERAFRAKMFTEMKELICTTFQEATVQLYGSSSNGLDTFRSDMDITVGDISLHSSLRSDVHSAMGLVDGGDLDGEEESDYEDERYRENPTPGSCGPAEVAKKDDNDEEETSFSLNIAMPGSSRSSDGYGYSSHQQVAAAPSTKSPWNPTLRRKKIRVLRALQYLLKVKRPHFQVKCLQKAKIPILMVLDPTSQLNMDIGVNRESFESSDHGRTTSLVIELQQVLGRSFTLLVTFLKEFLHQFDLDKPFTGGLGSFRLYIMVASLFPLEKSKRSGGGVKVVAKQAPSLSVLLLAFFQVFGNRKKPNYFHNNTVLALPFEDSAVDFSSVFRINDCVDAFAMAYDILAKTNSLGSIIYEDTLADERERARKATQGEPKPTSNKQPRGYNRVQRGKASF